MNWTQQQAIELAVMVEAVCPKFGCHVALTGGCLYKVGERKDLDLLFYRVRQHPKIEKVDLFLALQEIGLKELSGWGWCHKAEYEGKKIDCFFPEEDETISTFNLGASNSVMAEEIEDEQDEPDPEKEAEDRKIECEEDKGDAANFR